MCYPCIRPRRFDYTPSLLLTLDDLFLNYGGIEIIIKFYLDNISLINSDSYVNSLLIDKEVLKLMPSTYIYIGDQDPLYDDALRYLELLTD